MNSKYQKYQNSKIQGLFMCKRQIEKLRQKVLGLIQQPCEDFQWTSKEVKTIRSKFHSKVQTKSKSINKKIEETESIIAKLEIDKKQVQSSKKKFCPCTNFWSQQMKKNKRQVSQKKVQKQRSIFQSDSKTKKKLRSKTRQAKSKFFDKVTPKKINNEKHRNQEVEKSFSKYEIKEQSPKTIQKRNGKPFSIHTESTIDHTEEKKQNSPQSHILYSRTQRVSFQGDDLLAESFLLSQRSHTNNSEQESSLKNSIHQNKKSKVSLIRIQNAPERNSSENQKSYLNHQDESLIMSSLNSRYWKGSLRKNAESMKSEEQERKMNETNLLLSQKQNDQNILNRILMNKNTQKIDFSTCWKSGNSHHRSQHSRPLSLDLIKKICQRTQEFMNTQIYPFQKVLCDKQEIRNLRDSLGLSRSLIQNQQKHYESCRLWIDKNEQ